MTVLELIRELESIQNKNKIVKIKIFMNELDIGYVDDIEDVLIGVEND